MGNRYDSQVRELKNAGVVLQPVAVGKWFQFTRLLETPIDINDPSFPHGWSSFYRINDYSATSYFYLDKHPPICRSSLRYQKEYNKLFIVLVNQIFIISLHFKNYSRSIIHIKFGGSMFLRFIIAIFFIFLTEGIFAQTIPLDTAVHTGVLGSGFTFYISHNEELKNRIQHGTTHFPKNELVDCLQKSGVRFGAGRNAYTTFDETADADNHLYKISASSAQKIAIKLLDGENILHFVIQPEKQ
jgi:hypothetical protein